MIFSKQHQGSPLQPSPAPKLFFTECCADWINLAKFTISLHEKREESVIVLGQTTWGRRPSNFRSNCGIALRSPSLLWTGRLTLSCTLFVLFHSSHCIRFTLLNRVCSSYTPFALLTLFSLLEWRHLAGCRPCLERVPEECDVECPKLRVSAIHSLHFERMCPEVSLMWDRLNGPNVRHLSGRHCTALK